jgi:hypothetical protein
MDQAPEEKKRIMRHKRDTKVLDHFTQYAPVWMTDEQFNLEEDAIQFEVVFFHSKYNWVKRRYRYDSYQNVLYQLGQEVIDEESTFDLQNEDPYLGAEFVNTVDSYGG